MRALRTTVSEGDITHGEVLYIECTALSVYPLNWIILLYFCHRPKRTLSIVLNFDFVILFFVQC